MNKLHRDMRDTIFFFKKMVERSGANYDLSAWFHAVYKKKHYPVWLRLVKDLTTGGVAKVTIIVHLSEKDMTGGWKALREHNSFKEFMITEKELDYDKQNR